MIKALVIDSDSYERAMNALVKGNRLNQTWCSLFKTKSYKRLRKHRKLALKRISDIAIAKAIEEFNIPAEDILNCYSRHVDAFKGNGKVHTVYYVLANH
tara:strand:+ start:757 stop:1053 length:297 start_codon:yes stop_codon:yes gene_type:complete